MTSTAKIAELTTADAVLIPYGGEQHTVGELKARNVTLTAEDYALIRKALGGGKRGRARARELVPLECPYCECRLTHFEPAQRPPYFAPTLSSAEHRERCELRSAEKAHQPVLATVESTPVCEEPSAATITAAAFAAIAPAALELTVEGASLCSSDAATESPTPSEHDSAAALLSDTALYVIQDTSEHESDTASLRARLGIMPEVLPDWDEPTGEHAIALPDARELLTQALNRRVPGASQVHFRGQRHAIVSATELHRHSDGELVAVYGRICDVAWSEVSGRLTLMAAPRTVQVWATAAVPRFVLGLRQGDPIKAPLLRKPVPFIAFGRLKKLAAVCGIPVIRRECFVMLLPLEHATTTPPIPSVQTTSLRDLTDELDELLSAPRSAQPAEYISAEAAIAQAYASPSDDARQ